MTKTTRIVAAVACYLAVMASESLAGPLFNHPDAIPGWTGSVSYDGTLSTPSNPNLRGEIEYAVFTAGQFNSNFGGLGYVPGDAVVYTYQIINSGLAGTDSISTEIIGIVNPANTIGTFDIGDVNAATAAFVPPVGGNARWTFSPEIGIGESSWGLAFSSPNLPQVGLSLTIDGGSSALTIGVPTPGPIPIPEPGSWMLLALGLAGGIARWTRRR